MSKHPLVSGIDLKAVRDLFVRHQETHYRLLLATAIEHLRCPAEEADAFYGDWQMPDISSGDGTTKKATTGR